MEGVCFTNIFSRFEKKDNKPAQEACPTQAL